MKRYKSVRAGRLVSEIIYEQATRADGDIVRQDKMKCSSLARQKLNNDTATHKLEMLLAANYTPDDLWVTLTYDDAHLPDGPDARKIAKGRAARFCKELRRARKIGGGQMVYVYGTESITAKGRRLHHHFVLNASGYTRDRAEWLRLWRMDVEQIKSLWRQGDAHVETFRMAARQFDRRSKDDGQRTPFDDEHLVFGSRNIWENVAAYIVKERREKDMKPIGEHAWCRSRNLRRPSVESDRVAAGEDIAPPPGAIVLADEKVSNGFGEYHWCKYILPKSN